jgi:uncharacterized protein involved in outer membrane biogenesis
MADVQLLRRWRGLPRVQRWAVYFCFAFFLYTVFGFLILPAIVRSQLEKKLSVALHRQTTVRQVRVNPYNLRVEVNGFKIQDEAGQQPFVSFDSLRVNLQAISLFRRAVVLESLSLSNPYCNIVYERDRSFNFSDLLAADSGKKEKGEEEGKPLQFSVNNIELTGGRIDFADRVKDVTHRITDLHIGLPFLSNHPTEVEIYTKPAFSAVINGTPVDMSGESKPFHGSYETELAIDFPGIDLTGYLAYLPENLNFVVRKGLLDLDLALSLIRHEDGNPAIKIQGRASLREVEIDDRQGQPLLRFPELTVDIDRAHILRKEFHLAGIRCREPELYLGRLPDGRVNLADLFPPAEEEEKAAPAANGAAVLLDVREAFVEAGTVHFTDQTVSGPLQTTLKPVDVQVRDFSTEPGTSAVGRLALDSESGEHLDVDGTFSLDPLHVAVDVDMEDIRPGKYRPYYENVLRAEIAADRVDAAAHVEVAGPDGSVLISGLGIELGNVVLTGPDPDGRIVFPEFAVSGTTLNVKEKTVVVGECIGKGAVIPLARRRDGTLNVQDFLAAPAPEAEEEKDSDAGGEPGWQFVIQALDFSGFAVRFTDQVPAQPASFSLNELRLACTNVTNRPQESGAYDLVLRLNDSGTLKVHGTAVLTPFVVQLDIDLNDFPLRSLQPYVGEQMSVVVEKGSGAIKGKLSLAGQQAEGAVVAMFAGDVRSRRFVCLDARQRENLLSGNDFEIKSLDVQTNPLRVAAREVLLDGLSVFISIDKDGVINLGTLTGKEEKKEPQEGAQEKSAPPDVKVSQVRLADCKVVFTDQSVSPRFDASLQRLNGSITGLSSSRDVFAKVDITGKLDGQSPLELTGSIHPWQDFFTDITADFSDIELNPLSPYSMKFIGYPFTKGKLSLNLHYIIEGAKLTSENKAFIDQITLGDFVKNETAVSLPVQLAISLLKDRKGEIDLNIPVSGRLDDPQFSVVKIVFKVLRNLIAKAATAPFALLGAAFGGGEDAQYVRFTPGRAAIVAEDTDMLVKLAKVLYERPGIKTELMGGVDAAADGEALARIRFDRLLKVQKMADTAGKEGSVSDVDAVEISTEEYERYLKKAYKAADFERPKNFLGLLKDIPPDEMEKLLYDHIVVTDSDLRHLAMERTAAVRDVLVEKGPVEPGRIYLIEPRISGPEEKQLGVRVEITIR